MAKRTRKIELFAYCVALVGPLALYVAHRNACDRAAPEASLDLTVDQDLESSSARTVIPFVESGESYVGTQADRPFEQMGRPVDGASIAFALVAGDVSASGLLVQQDVPRYWGKGAVKGRPLGPSSAAPEGYVDDYLYAAKPANLDVVPERHRELIGKRVDVYGEAGKICGATVTGLEVVSELNGDPYELIDGLEPDDEWKLTPAQGRKLRARVYAQEERWLMAMLDHDEDCGKTRGLFARGASLPAPKMLIGREMQGERSLTWSFMSKAKAQMHDAYEAYRTDLDPEWAEDWPAWKAYVRKTYERRFYVDGAGRPQFVFQVVGDTQSVCGDGFGDYYSELRTLSTNDEGAAVAEAVSFLSAPRVFVDIDDDGRYEMIAGDGERTLYDANGDYMMSAFRPYMGCPC